MPKLPKASTWWSGRIIAMRRDKRRTLFTGVLYLLAIGWLDYVTGYEINLTVVYVTPLIMFTVAGGWRAGMLMAFACAFTVEFTDVLAGRKYDFSIYHIYSFISHSLSYLSFLFLITQLLKLYDDERDLAGRDPLTGLRNRYGFLARAEEALGEYARKRRGAAMLVWNVAKLRQVNAEHGHDKADALLMSVADALAECAPCVAAARLTADRFAVLTESSGEDASGDVADKIERAMNAAAVELGVPLALRRSGAFLPPLRRTPEELAATLDGLLDSVK